MEAVWLALIVAAGAFANAWFSAHVARRNRNEDYARQDEVAARADAVASKAEEAARLLVIDNARRAAALETSDLLVNGKLDQIHGLVNSTLTAAKESELYALRGQLAALLRILDLQPTGADRADVAELERRIAELAAQLADRATQTEMADRKVKPDASLTTGAHRSTV
jgi:hypothetical protein